MRQATILNVTYGIFSGACAYDSGERVATTGVLLAEGRRVGLREGARVERHDHPPPLRPAHAVLTSPSHFVIHALKTINTPISHPEPQVHHTANKLFTSLTFRVFLVFY